jgi:ABC-type transport system substrate-binding protein
MRTGGWARKSSAAVLLGALLLGACTGDDGGGGDDGQPGRATTVPAGEVVEGGRVRLGLPGAVVADPLDASLGLPSDLLVLDLLHDGLTRLDADGVPVPALADDWRSNDTLTAWRFTLDDGARFTSGRGVTAADVIASLERIAKAGDSSLAALRLEAITGFRDFVAGTTEHLAGLSAPDARTVRIAVDTPMSVLPTILASPVYGVVDVASLEAAAGDPPALDEADLSGAWVPAVDGDTVSLTRRDGTPGHLEGVTLRAYEDGDAAYDAFDDGEVDWAPVPLSRYGDAVEDHGDEHFAPFHAELFFGLNVRVPALANADLRRAIAAAIDREAIVEAVYADLADPLSTVVPVGVPGHDADRCQACGHDPDRAEALLAAAFPDGQVPVVHIDFDESPAQEAMARLVAQDLEAVGIPSELRPLPLEDYKRFVVAGTQELFSFGWIGGYASPDAYLAPLFASTASDNLTGYGAPAVDAALAAARGSDAAASAATDQWAAAEAQVLSDAVVVPIAQFRTQVVLDGRVQGFAHAVDGTVDWAAVWVADGR